MTLPQDKPHITAGEIFKIKRKYDIFSYLSNIPGISSETLEILKKSENFKNNELKNLSPLSTDESDSQSFWDSLQSTSYSLPIPEFPEYILSKGPKNPKGFKIPIKMSTHFLIFSSNRRTILVRWTLLAKITPLMILLSIKLLLYGSTKKLCHLPLSSHLLCYPMQHVRPLTAFPER